ncbi:DUF2851 family protein [Chloroflexota bacterium]
MNVWQRKLMDGDVLFTEDGKKVEIIYPGRPNDGRGADFRDAVISTGEGIVKGDIEIHIRSSGWMEHGHHRDSAYNRVILHVVMWHNAKSLTRLQNGRVVPVLALENYIDIQDKRWFGTESAGHSLNVPCSECFRQQDKHTLLEFIEDSGEKRFLEKAAGFQKDITRMGAGQSLYRGIMGALGYSRNKQPFLELAHRLSLQTLESVAGDRISGEDYLTRQQSLLLGTAGLLSERYEYEYTENRLDNKRLERPESLRAIFRNVEPMSAGDWQLYKIRPNNSPVRRLIAMSYLLLRYKEKGLLDGLVGFVGEIPENRVYRGLERGLKVNALGSGRAADIVVNVLLPFTFAWSKCTSRPELGKKSLYLYRHYPGTPVNSVEKHMTEQLGLSRDLVNSAARQQGLIHIYNNLCTQGRCEDCFLKR